MGWGLFWRTRECLASFTAGTNCSPHCASFWKWVSGKYAWSWSSALLKPSPLHHVGQGGLAEPRGGYESRCWWNNSVLGSVWLCLFMFRLPSPLVFFLSSVFLLPESSVTPHTPLLNFPCSELVFFPSGCWNLTAYSTLGRM